MGKELGYKNLELGRGWNKGISNKTQLKCAICGKIIYRNPSHITSKNAFCSRKHKEKGMVLGLVAPMRLGTGYGVKDILTRRKYYKYRIFDKHNNYNMLQMNVREFCKYINESECYYCGSKDNLGLDRIDNTKGHNIDNVVPCCDLCNMTRGNRFTVEEMKMIGNVIRNIKESKYGTSY